MAYPVLFWIRTTVKTQQLFIPVLIQKRVAVWQANIRLSKNIRTHTQLYGCRDIKLLQFIFLCWVYITQKEQHWRWKLN